MADPRPPKLADDIVDDFLRLIATGALGEGDRLPTEIELCDQYGVSRSAVREAVQVLAGKGLVVARRGSGTVVAPRDAWQTLDPAFLRYRLGDARFGALMEAREILEPSIARLAATRAEPAQRRLVRRALRRQQDAVDDGDHLQFSEADLDFHLQLAMATHNPVLLSMYESVFSLSYELRLASSEVEGAMARAVEWHERLAAAIDAGDAEAAAEVMAGHMHQVRAEYVAAAAMRPPAAR